MSLSEKFEYLIETKRLIKEAIKAKGVAVSDNDTFRSYATKIGNIQGGSSTVGVLTIVSYGTSESAQGEITQ